MLDKFVLFNWLTVSCFVYAWIFLEATYTSQFVKIQAINIFEHISLEFLSLN